MYKVAILGCENSHADTFLRFIYDEKIYSDIEIIGLYSDDIDAAKKLGDTYNIYIASNYDEFVGKVDGIIITARHGDNHYKYAKPYIDDNIPMFIDKPITVSESDACDFINELKTNTVRVCGGSCCKHAQLIKVLKETVKTDDTVNGGAFRAPINMVNDYGNFFFYSQHLVEVICEVFGRYPKSVNAFKNENKITVVFHYDKYDVTGAYCDGFTSYFATVFLKDETKGGSYPIDDACFKAELDELYKLLCGEEQPMSYEDFIAPVYILNAIHRSYSNNREEKVVYYGQ